jgi:hypothetical protein
MTHLNASPQLLFVVIWARVKFEWWMQAWTPSVAMPKYISLNLARTIGIDTKKMRRFLA